MKNILFILLAACLTSVESYADDITDGFYRVVNIGLAEIGNTKGEKETTYCRVADASIPINKNSGTAQDFETLQMWPGLDEAIASPASVIYIKKTESGWDLQAQGMSVEEAIKSNSGLGSINWSMTGNTNSCELSATALGQKMYLWAFTRKIGGHYKVTTTPPGSDAYKKWKLIKINNEDNYVAVKPRFTIQKDGETKYYAPYYASYAFKLLSNGMKVFYVSAIGQDYYTLKEITTEVIPEKTPVLIECSSENLADNKIMPVHGSYPAIYDNKLSGCYFHNPYTNSETRLTTFDPKTIRAWNIEGGKLVLSNNMTDYDNKKQAGVTGFYLLANESYTKVTEGTNAILYEGTAKPQFTSMTVDKTEATVKIFETTNTVLTTLDTQVSAGKTAKAVSSDNAVATITPQATVDAEGKAEFTITATGAGTATITYSMDGTDLTATTVVTVPEPEIETFTVDNTELSVDYQATKTIKVTATPAYAAKGKTVTAVSSDDATAALLSTTALLDDNGEATFTVEGKKVGNADITFSVEGSELTATTSITVPLPALTTLTVDNATVTVEKGNTKTVTVSATAAVAAEGKTVRAVSSNTDAVTVTESAVFDAAGNASFTITAMDEGEATVTYHIDDTELTATTTVTVPTVQPDIITVNNTAIEVVYLETKTITVSALPVKHFANKTVTATIADNTIVSLDQTAITLDDNAEAIVTVTGKAFGTTDITFTLDGTELTATTTATVPTITVDAPQADLPTGSTFYAGKVITLTKSSTDDVIYYTEDGTEPTDASTKYVTPITLSNTVTIKAIAINGKGVKSDVAVFDYTLAANNDGIDLNAGWNWVSFNMESEKLKSYSDMLSCGTWADGDEIKDKYSFYDYAESYGKWLGTMQQKDIIHANHIDGMLKIHSNTAQHLDITGTAINPERHSVNIEAGWNFITFIPVVTMSVNDALADYTAKVNDMIKSQDAAAIYDGNEWTGTLTTMEPGKGYMLMHTDSTTATAFHYPLIYPTLTPAKSAYTTFDAKSMEGYTKDNVHLFSGNMNIVMECDDDTLQEGDAIVAIANGEVRGKSTIEDGAGKILMTIEGDEPVNIILAIERNGKYIATAKAAIPFADNAVIGSWTNPTAVEFVNAADATTLQNATIESIYGIDGKQYGNNPQTLSQGTYLIQTRDADGNTNVTKVIRK